ncbi:FkbM family methyltransferase [Rhizobium sp. BK251]|uniref:FkbM family methyltransferase n=1 Tax=Rhizobium sp. BK251 TaxID=2512125 RepID=UPI001053FE42|nr:FkbM family methyltransferase [Rhizobium sp. BK251]TCL75624.1 FkbM family methyltransferase [Rhizobium sp. BK251]
MTGYVSDPLLVYDLGMNNGDDAEYYLKRGFRVVGLEANPSLCEKARVRFAREIADGRMTVIHAAIWETSGETRFFVNLENDHWSSIDIGWAGRNESSCSEITVRCVTLPELFSIHGVPHYLKIDVEGVDHVVLEQLRSMDAPPRFVSVEDCRFGFEYMKSLAASGYDGFKLLDQSTVGGMFDEVADHAFKPGSSGPFGEDVPGPWLSYEHMVDLYSRTVRDFEGNRLAPRTQWWDIHCTRIQQSERE